MAPPVISTSDAKGSTASANEVQSKPKAQEVKAEVQDIKPEAQEVKVEIPEINSERQDIVSPVSSLANHSMTDVQTSTKIIGGLSSTQKELLVGHGFRINEVDDEQLENLARK